MLYIHTYILRFLDGKIQSVRDLHLSPFSIVITSFAILESCRDHLRSIGTSSIGITSFTILESTHALPTYNPTVYYFPSMSLFATDITYVL